MFLLLCMCLVGFFAPRGDAQDRAALWRGNDRSGRCQYTFTVASPAEASCPQAGGPEMEAVKARLSTLEALVSRLTDGGRVAGATAADSGAELREAMNRAVGERNLLQGEKERLERELGSLQRRLEEMLRETETLRNTPCSPQTPAVPDGGLMRPAADPAWQQSFQELKAEVTQVPAPEEYTGCGVLASVSEPVTHRKADSIAGKYGVWMQDPEAVTPHGSDTVWRIDTVGSDVRQLFSYESLEQLSKGFPTKVVLLPEPVEGTGGVLYRGSLYYQRRRSRTLIRFDLASERVAARRDLPHAGFHGQFPYSWGGYTDIDLAVDERGLWAVYSTSKAKGAVVLSRLDPHDLRVTRSWETNIRKNGVANAFVICGRLYTVASYAAANTTVNYVYDTESSRGHALAIPFQNKYRYNSMIDYNPTQKKLFAWDNFHMVSYDVRLGRPTPAA
ncbi:myocilin isoform X2 [Syngnathoides biaculeatus]|uniref:myocilin isoform X2 n=1 Tax=Syngnathoides biaculeatus TaxID=300417 RepID=UPI002ADE1CFD|nr:myocilin isoform X2 [Syngnathoides biaculeatus]